MLRPVMVLGSLLLLSATCVLGQDSEALYNQKCGNCHAKDGSGRTTAAQKLEVPDLRTKRIKDMSDEELYNSTAHGTQHKEYPHAFLHTGMSEEQIRGLVKYIRFLQSSSAAANPRASGKP